MSKSVLRRIEKVAPEALAELREQIAQEIEAHDDTSPFPCGCQNTYANIARGK